jgi:phosphatidylserine/phosphatidylglycerophosphate/cardiolipin synthase-like enzyme
VIAIDERRSTIVEVLGMAKKRILMSIFRCSDFHVLDALAEALARGVHVELLMTPLAKGWEKKLTELAGFVESLGAVVHKYSDPVVKYHAKYLLVDDGPAVVASLNITKKCFTESCDFMLITHDREVIAGLEKLFDADKCAPETEFPDGISERLFIGPDRARTQFTEFLASAKYSIRIIDHKLTDPAIVALLKAKQAQGVVVDILRQGRVAGMVSHGRLSIVDERKAVFGSMSLCALSLDFRREVAVMLDDPECVARLNQFYQEAMESSPDASAARKKLKT